MLYVRQEMVRIDTTILDSWYQEKEDLKEALRSMFESLDLNL